MNINNQNLDTRFKIVESYRNKIQHCKDAEIVFTLTFEQFRYLKATPCLYCGELELSMFDRTIDRIDPTKGYIVKNCVSCCRHCNLAKSNLSLTDWFDRTESIVSRKWFIKQVINSII